MIDFRLSEEQQLLQKTARDFARREILPVADLIHQSETRNAEPWSHCEDMYRKGKELGFTTLLVPEAYGGLGLRCIDAAIVFEELATADISIAADYFSLNATVPLIILTAGSEQQKSRWLEEFCNSESMMLSGALSEPNVAGSELFCPIPDPKLGIKTFAERKGDEYIVNGQKSAFVTNSGLAENYFILARTDLTRPQFESISIFYVPAGTPGLKTGKRTEMIGWHTSRHAEVFLDQVRVPVTNRIGAEGAAVQVMSSLPQMPICLAACFVGLARAAYDCAFNYANTRKSGGVTINQHQSVALKLADMYVDLQTARLLVRDAAISVDSDPMTAATLKAPAAKTHAVDVAIRNAQRAVEILGGYGITAEYPAGRYLNDAWIGYACDFTREMLRLGMAPFLQGGDDS